MPSLYAPEDHDRLPWPSHADGAYARRYLAPMMASGTRAFLTNVETRMHVLLDEDQVIPLSENTAQYENSYVAGPYNLYVTYAKEEVRMLEKPALRYLLAPFFAGLGAFLKAGSINRTVHVNNWLLSTNLYPALSASRIGPLTDFLASKFPSHAIVFRSVCPETEPELFWAFVDRGYLPVASRVIYYQRPADDGFYNANERKTWKKDLKLLEASGYECLGPEALGEADLPRVLDLYNQLYLQKYPEHNPQFTLEYLRLALHAGILELRALRKDGRIDGAIGYYGRQGVMTTPLFGYELSLPQETGLYRMLSAITYREAKERALILHQSSGVGNFKRSRGGRMAAEFNMVHVGHLGARQRLAWQGLRSLVDTMFVPVIEAEEGRVWHPMRDAAPSGDARKLPRSVRG